jgi:hypothetical protein
MQQVYILFKLILLYLISPGLYLSSRYKLPADMGMLLRMTVNITYYTAIIAIIFIIKYKQ